MSNRRYDRCQDCGKVYAGGYHRMRCPECQRKQEEAARKRWYVTEKYGDRRDPIVCPMCGRVTWRDSGFCTNCERRLYKQNAMIDSYMGAMVSNA